MQQRGGKKLSFEDIKYSSNHSTNNYTVTDQFLQVQHILIRLDIWKGSKALVQEANHQMKKEAESLEEAMGVEVMGVGTLKRSMAVGAPVAVAQDSLLYRHLHRYSEVISLHSLKWLSPRTSHNPH